MVCAVICWTLSSQPLLGGTGGAAAFWPRTAAMVSRASWNSGPYPISSAEAKAVRRTPKARAAPGAPGAPRVNSAAAWMARAGLGAGRQRRRSASTSGGGGGGGGYYGGGGGGGSADCQNDDACADFWSGAGGGGGGSSLVPTTGGEGPFITGLSPSIVISYQGRWCRGTASSYRAATAKEECKKGGYEEFGFKNQGRCIKAVNHPS